MKYVKELYSTSKIFRHQFHRCRGYCYYKLLYKLKTLPVSGRGRTMSGAAAWNDDIRDRRTSIADGDVFHMCNRCGEAVCKQDDGLRVEFGEFGQSTSHLDTTHHHVADSDQHGHGAGTVINATSQLRERTLAATMKHIDQAQLTNYRQLIFNLPVTSHVRKYAKTQCRSFYELMMDTTLPRARREKLMALACDAMRMKIHDEMKQHSGNVRFERKPWEEKIVQEWKSAIRLSAKDMQRGIAPRKDFRPHLQMQPPAQSHDNWKRLHRELNNKDKLWHNIFDWTSAQNTNDFYEHNDVYACVNPPVVDERKYTSLPQLAQSTLRGTPESWSRNTLQPRFLLTRVVGHPPARPPFCHPITLPRLQFRPQDSDQPAFGNAAARRHSDSKRRQTILSHTHGTGADSGTLYPRTIQLLLQSGVLTERATVDILHCILGITAKQKLRKSTNPSVLLSDTDWVKYYLQMDPTQPNDYISQQLKQIKREISPAVTKDPQSHSLNKFMT